MKQNFVMKLLISAGLIAAAGCTAPSFHPLSLKNELQYTQYVKEKYAADKEWWKLYQNEQLNALIEQALKNNPDYLKAAININKELYNLNLKTADLFPTMEGSLGASSQRQIDRGDNFASNFSGEFGLNYEADLYGKIRDARSAQEFEYQATVQDKEAARLSLVNSVVDLFFNLEYLDNSIALSKVNVKVYQDIRNIMQNKYDNGKIDNLEVAQAKQSLLSEKNKLLELETQFREMEQSLRNILNIRPEEKLNITYANLLEQQEVKVSLDIPMSVLANRPDLAASEYRLKKAFKNLRAEQKNWYPNISLRGAVGSSSDKARTTFDFPFLLGSASIDLPFLDWTRVKNNIKISEADYDIALIEFKDTLNQALNEVAYYYFAYDKSREIYANTAENYKNAAEITSYYESRYNNGKTEFRDFLEAINTENTTQKDMLQQKYQIIKYENYIYKAMAGRYTLR